MGNEAVSSNPSSRLQSHRLPLSKLETLKQRIGEAMTQIMWAIACTVAVVAIAMAVPAFASPVESALVRVRDGDTTQVGGVVYRLVGFDAPEVSRRAQCISEIELGIRARTRLRKMVAAGALDFERVACPCRLGTEGTSRCNRGRLCGTLKSHGRDVGKILIGEGLARPLICGPRSCPPGSRGASEWLDILLSEQPIGPGIAVADAGPG
jgi:endonuclease YncB( thermonuclease family)